MAHVIAMGTYLPPWEGSSGRVAGPDEDAVTMAVAAGRAADPLGSATRVVMVTRNFPLLEGGSGGVLLAALSLPACVPVAEVLGGAPAALDQICEGEPGTLVIAVDDSDFSAGAAAVLLGDHGGLQVDSAGRQSRSLPVVIRRDDGSRRAYNDPRLLREIGLKESLSRLAITNAARLVAAAGVKVALLKSYFDTTDAVEDPSLSAAAAIRVLADAAEAGSSGLAVAVEQATISVANVTAGAVKITRDEADSVGLPKFRTAPGGGIPVSLASYARAFEPKLRWEAAVFDDDEIDVGPLFPPRLRVSATGGLLNYRMEPLPRAGTIYTQAGVQIPVPDLPSPYTLAVVQLDNSPVRVLLKVTGASMGQTKIGDRGTVVFRRIAVRTGVPDYGYMFWPDKQADAVTEGAVA